MLVQKSISQKSSHPKALSEVSWDESPRKQSQSGDNSPTHPHETYGSDQALSFLPQSKPRSLFGSRQQNVDGTTETGLPSTHPYALFEPTPFTSNMESNVDAAMLAHSGMKMEGSKTILKEAQKAVKASGSSQIQPLKKVTIAQGERNPRACPWDA